MPRRSRRRSARYSITCRTAGERERDERPDPDTPAGEAGDALRVDEDLADLEPCEECGRHAGAVALEELDQVEVRADRDDQLGALLVGKQEREVLADARHGDDLVAE